MLVQQLGPPIVHPLRRIVSCVPSLTETIFDLGVGDAVVGCTWFCVHPREEVAKLTKIGGTKNLKLDKLNQLQPDVIIAAKEENEREQIEELASLYPVLLYNVQKVEENERLLLDLAGALSTQVPITFLRPLPEVSPILSSCIYLIWKQPFMTVGGDTFISEVLELNGFTNMYKGEKRYPSLSLQDIKSAQPEHLLLSSEPYPFQEADVAELQRVLPHTRVLIVDGEKYSWYGSRFVKLNLS